MLFALMALVDDANNPVRAQRIAIRPAEPPARILYPCRFNAPWRAQGISELVGNPAPLVAEGGLLHHIGARRPATGNDPLGKGGAGRKPGWIGNAQHVTDIAAPADQIAIETPVVRNFAGRDDGIR